MFRFTLPVLTGLALAFSAAAAPDTWQLDPAHSSAQFAVQHMGISTVRGAFTKMTGTVQYDAADVTKSSLDVTIDAGSIDTHVEQRDNDLRGDHFFDVQKYPNITFRSTKVESAGADKLKITGDLTIHGVTKQVVLDVDGPTKPINGPRGSMHMGASATTVIRRSDFGMRAAIPMVGDEITITIDADLAKAGGGAK